MGSRNGAGSGADSVWAHGTERALEQALCGLTERSGLWSRLCVGSRNGAGSGAGSGADSVWAHGTERALVWTLCGVTERSRLWSGVCVG